MLFHSLSVYLYIQSPTLLHSRSIEIPIRGTRMMVVIKVLSRICQLATSGMTVIKTMLINGYIHTQVNSAIFHFLGFIITFNL